MAADTAVSAADRPDTESTMAAAPDAVPWPWDWDWRQPPHQGDTDAAVARAARQWRTAWRVAHPEAWRRELESLPHYEPGYTYNESHEYGYDWTTDPDYAAGEIHQACFDKDDFVTPIGPDHTPLIGILRTELRRRHGTDQALRVLNEPDYHFPAELAERLGLITPGGHPSTMMRPDLVVLPEGWDDRRLPQSRVLHVDEHHPVPVLVAEVLPHSTEDRSQAKKRALYEALGVQEFLLIDPGSPADGQDAVRPPCLALHRLQADGSYGPAATGAAVHSVACDTDLRMLPPPDPSRAPVFQWRDPETGRWRDQETDYAFALTTGREEGRAEGRAEGREEERAEGRAEDHAEGREEGHAEGREEGRAEGREEGRAEERLELALRLLDRVLPTDADRAGLARHWTAHGVPDNIDDLMFAVMAEPDRWREILGIPPASR